MTPRTATLPKLEATPSQRAAHAARLGGSGVADSQSPPNVTEAQIAGTARRAHERAAQDEQFTFGKNRADELIRIGTGATTVAEQRDGTRERMQQSRAKRLSRDNQTGPDTPTPALRRSKSPDEIREETCALEREQHLIRRKIRERAHAMRVTLVARFPKCFQTFGAPKQPLAIGVFEMVTAAAPDLDRHDLTNALADYASGATYHRAMVADAARVDLDGNPVGVVTAGGAGHAARMLAKKRESMKRVRGNRTPRGVQSSDDATAPKRTRSPEKIREEEAEP